MAVFDAAGGSFTADLIGHAIPGSSPTTFTVVETYTIREGSGTGRLAGAIGSFTVTRGVDFLDPFTSGTIDGSITMR